MSFANEDVDEIRVSKKCSDCGSLSFELINATGEEVCMDCGLVYSNMAIDEGPDWKKLSRFNRCRKRR